MFGVRLRQVSVAQSGFTLIELLVVAAIILILAVIALPVYANMTDKTRITVGQTRLKEIEKALEVYHAAKGHYPSRLGLLVESGNIRPEYLETPWSTSESPPLYYFYATDGHIKPRGYALGDPGPNPPTCNANQKTRVFNPLEDDLPCAKDPFKEDAWSYTGSKVPHLTGVPDECLLEDKNALYPYTSFSGCPRKDLIYER